MIDESPTIFVIDDDPSARRGLSRLIMAGGMRVEPFESARDFLDQADNEIHGCIVLDVKMPGLSGLDLQAELIKKNIALPIIFISGHSEIQDAAVAMKKGAIDFLTKPIDGEHLFKAITESLEKNRENREGLTKRDKIQKRLDSLTPREYTVLKYVISGMLNKQIAFELDITEDTVKVHRGRVMKKMSAASLAELVRLAESVNVKPADVED